MDSSDSWPISNRRPFGEELVKGDPPYLNFNTELLRKIGIWSTRGALYRFLWFVGFMLVMYVGVYVSFSTQIYIAYNDIVILTECLSEFSIFIVTSHKLMTFELYKEDFEYMLVLIKNNFFSSEQRNDPKQHNVLLDRDKEARVLTYVFALFVLITVCFLCLLTPQDLIFHAEQLNSTTSHEWRFPFRMKVPLDTSSSFVYWVVYFYHSCVGFTHVIIIPACDNFFIALLTHVQGQFTILRHSLEHMHEDATHTPQNRKEVHSNKLFLNHQLVADEIKLGEERNGGTKNCKNMQRRLADCVHHHQTILKFVDRLEKVLNPIMLNQFFTSSIVFCAAAFQITKFQTDGIKLVSMSAFLLGEMVQIGMYCYFADKIKEQSDLVGYSAYWSQWPDASPDIKRSLRIIMTRSQRPALLTVGKFAELSLSTFAGILRGSYTYFTLLNEFSD